MHSSTNYTTSKKNGKTVHKTYTMLSGRVTRGKLGVVNASVNVYYGSNASHLVSTRWQSTDKSGRFSYQTQVAPPYKYFQAHAKVPARVYPAALCLPAVVSSTCSGVSTAATTILLNVVQVRAK